MININAFDHTELFSMISESEEFTRAEREAAAHLSRSFASTPKHHTLRSKSFTGDWPGDNRLADAIWWTSASPIAFRVNPNVGGVGMNVGVVNPDE